MGLATSCRNRPSFGWLLSVARLARSTCFAMHAWRCSAREQTHRVSCPAIRNSPLVQTLPGRFISSFTVTLFIHTPQVGVRTSSVGLGALMSFAVLLLGRHG